MPLLGIDASDFQGAVDWHAVKAAGRSFAFCKATEGVSFIAHSFSANWHGIKAAGLIRGAYHFGRPGSDPVAQAEFFWKTVSGAGYGIGDLPLVLDLETTDGASPERINAWTEAFVGKLTILSGRKPMIYTGASFYSGPNLGCLLWLPSYFQAPITALRNIDPKLPPAWEHWTFWQHTDKMTVPGVHGPCDHSIFDGSLVDLQALAGINPPRTSLRQRLTKAGFGPKSIVNVIKALAKWNGKPGKPQPGDSDLFRRLTSAGFGADSARKIVEALRGKGGK